LDTVTAVDTSLSNLALDARHVHKAANSSKKLSKPDATAIIVQQAMRLLN